MIEQALIFALGFLSCALLSLLILPAFWRRAMRLSRRRLEMLMPLSMGEVMAQRDQLRAQAAVDQRRIEQKLEAMTEERARHMSEIGRRAGVIARLEAEIEQLKQTLGAREGDLREAWTELGGMHMDSRDRESRLREAEQARATGARTQARLQEQFDFLRIEKAALELQVNALQAQSHDLRQQLASLRRDESDAEAADVTLAAYGRSGHHAPLN